MNWKAEILAYRTEYANYFYSVEKVVNSNIFKTFS